MSLSRLWKVASLLLFSGAVMARAGPAAEALPAKAPSWIDGFRFRYLLRVVGADPAANPAKTVTARLPTGGWLKPDGSDLVVQTESGKTIPVAVLSHDPVGDTLVQFLRNGNDRWYWIYAGSDRPPARGTPAPEGVTYEVRDWAGENLDSWPQVLAGLKKSDKIIGNGLTANIIQNCNPARPDQPRKFAVSYRGYLNIKKAGVYRFFLNCDDAAFLFIDGFKVSERTGPNQRRVGQIPLRSIGNDIELKAGVHPLEVHHAVGDNPASIGYCTLIWLPPEAKAWQFVRHEDFAQPLYAEVASLEAAGGAPAACFVWGIEDVLITAGTPMFLTRFQAQGRNADTAQLAWEFGDGTTGTGGALNHLYFRAGTYTVTLRSGNLPPFRRNIHVWPAPGNTSPFSLGAAVRAFAAMEWKRLDTTALNQMLEFLLVCEQPERWPVLDKLCDHLLAAKEGDPKQRALLFSTRMEALAEQGRGHEALKLLEPALNELNKTQTLQVSLKLTAADIYRRHLKEPAEAGKFYQAILDEHRRLEHPDLRLAAIRWGDLFVEAGDLAAAGERYRLAAALGGDKFKNTAQTEAITRGALLRIAEQKLKSGDIRQTRQLLDRIELDYPEQKLEGLYRFLRAEADRHAGRYDDAIRHYEFLLKLPQWAGLRDRTLHGIADSHFRAGNCDAALKWLTALEESFPRYVEQHKLADYRRLIEGQRESAKKTHPADGCRTAFEPSDKPFPGKIEYLKIVPSFGIVGPHVATYDMWPTTPVNTGSFRLPMTGFAANRYYWVELWYREAVLCSNLPHLVIPAVQATLYDNANAYNADGGHFQPSLEKTYGVWRKVGFLLKPPAAQEGYAFVGMNYGIGSVEFDGLTIVPLSDRQHDILQSFIEGSEKP